MRVLVLNGGTGTVKIACATVTAGEARVDSRDVVEARPGASAAELFHEALARVAGRLADVEAVGHRVVHGGTRFTTPVRIDAVVEAGIEELSPLAPLHNPVALAGIRAARERLPAAPSVAVFDTAFHAARPPAARLYALPADITEQLGLYRYGFHGIAHASLAAGAAALENRSAGELTAITLQLGHGCSACAIVDGASIETSMGFTPLEGLVMATRVGDVDAGVILHLLRHGHGVDEVEDLLTRRSGLRGVGGSADMRVLLPAEARGDARAALAIELFVRRIVTTVGAYLTLTEGRGALVFGGGIGENAPEIRRRVGAGLGAWGVTIDPERNAGGGPGRISSETSRPVYVVRTDEETLIAQAVWVALATP